MTTFTEDKKQFPHVLMRGWTLSAPGYGRHDKL